MTHAFPTRRSSYLLLALPHISLRYGKPVDCDVFNLHVTYSKFEGDPASGAFSGAVEAGPVNPRGDFHCAGLLPPNRQARPDRADGSSSKHLDLVAGVGVEQAVIGGTLRLARLQRRSRSEEHTSELQSLMRISYADFCLT